MSKVAVHDDFAEYLQSTECSSSGAMNDFNALLSRLLADAKVYKKAKVDAAAAAAGIERDDNKRAGMEDDEDVDEE